MIKFNIKLLRLKHNNMSQRELIELSGIRRDTLSKLENNSAKTISVDQIDTLCRIFNCQPSELMTFCPNDDKCQYCFNDYIK